MTYRYQWKTIAARIRGLVQAGSLYADFLAVNSSDAYGTFKYLGEQCNGILSELENFCDRFQNSLPQSVLTTVRGFIAMSGRFNLTKGVSVSPDAKQVQAVLVLLSAFETEVSYLLSDEQESIRARSELAFTHLQRSIVADDTFRHKWQTAFSEGGEVACEKLGAVHLLLHGIWAFKVHAEGGRTDLVLQEPAGDLIDEQRYVDGFVLTEWKKAKSADDAPKRFEEARKQAELYASGVLAGSELRGYRYAVVVSPHQVDVPDDLEKNEVVYRHINISVDPKTPSRV